MIFYYFAIKCAAVTCKHASVFCLYENNQIKVSTNTFSFNCNPENGPLEKDVLSLSGETSLASERKPTVIHKAAQKSQQCHI